VLESFANLERGIFGSFMKEIFWSVWLIKCSMNLDPKKKKHKSKREMIKDYIKVW